MTKLPLDQISLLTDAEQSKYGVLIRWHTESDCWVAQCWDMPGIMADGQTREEALRELMIALGVCLQIEGNAPASEWEPGSPKRGSLTRAEACLRAAMREEK